MPDFIAKRLVQLLIKEGKNPSACKVLVKGITFKENVADIRNSKVVDLIKELMRYSVNVHLTDPYASPNEVAHEYKLTMVDQLSDNYDAVVVAVSHKEYKDLDLAYFKSIMNSQPVLIDLKSMYDYPEDNGMVYWRL